MGAPATIIERKHKPDGRVLEFSCTLAARRPGFIVVSFPLPEGGTPFGAPVQIPPGSVSYGWFWARRPYNLYRMFGPDGALVAHRFDAVADVRLWDHAVDYRDLVLDWWVLPDDTILEEDRDELEALSTAGQLSPEDVALANRAARDVLSRYRHIIDDVELLERRLQVRGSEGG